jgi:hypothetical protein
MLKNLNHIAQGFLNLTFKSKHWEDLANRRLAICDTCDKLDLIGKSCKIPGSQPCCKLCGCMLESKVRSDSKCPLNKW